MINILKKVYKKLHIIHNIHFKNKFLLKKKSYSMEGEDLQLLKLTKNISQGFYVDAGCYHPLRLSNTYLLYKKKWSSITNINHIFVDELFLKQLD